MNKTYCIDNSGLNYKFDAIDNEGNRIGKSIYFADALSFCIGLDMLGYKKLEKKEFCKNQNE